MGEINWIPGSEKNEKIVCSRIFNTFLHIIHYILYNKLFNFLIHELHFSRFCNGHIH